MDGKDGELERLMREVIETGNLDPAVLEEKLRTADPATVARLTKMLEDAGADEVGYGAPLNIADFYREAPGKFALRWPLGELLPGMLPAGSSFDDLDRKTQFFCLFTDWSRRELEGMSKLNGGAVSEAETIFNECVERAEQIGVNELLARSYEDLMRVAEMRGDAAQAGEWSGKAEAARRAG
jgi:hypothetical protein